MEDSLKAERILIMDAIDGSTNAVRGVPFFCCSLAYATENKLSSVSAGIVQDLSNGDAYWASSGKGAFLNGTPMHVYSGEAVVQYFGIEYFWSRCWTFGKIAASL